MGKPELMVNITSLWPTPPYVWMKTIGKPWENGGLPSGKHTKKYGKSPCLMGKLGKSKISMAMFNSKLLVLSDGNIGVSINGGTPIAGWFTKENPNLKWMMI